MNLSRLSLPENFYLSSLLFSELSISPPFYFSLLSLFFSSSSCGVGQATRGSMRCAAVSLAGNRWPICSTPCAHFPFSPLSLFCLTLTPCLSLRKVLDGAYSGRRSKPGRLTNLVDERNRLFSPPFSVVMAQDAHGAHVKHRFVSPARSPSLGGA